MNSLINQYRISKILEVVLGGKNRQESIRNGIIRISKEGGPDDDIVVIHDGVRPLVQNVIISENIRIAKKYGCAMTVKPVVESVCITKSHFLVNVIDYPVMGGNVSRPCNIPTAP